MAVYLESEDLINIGAYVNGTDPRIDRSLKYVSAINSYLKQGIDEKDNLDNALKELTALLAA